MMVTFKSFFWILLLFTSLHCYANVTIQCDLINLKSKLNIFYYEPYANGSTNDRFNPQKININSNNAFFISKNCKRNGIFVVNINLNWLRIFTEPGDSIKIIVFFSQTNTNIIDSFQFQGSNAVGQALFNNNSQLMLHQDFILPGVFLNNTPHNSKDLVLRSNFLIDSIIAKFDSLQTHKEIDEQFYKAINVNLKATFVCTFFLTMDNLLVFKQHKISSKNNMYNEVLTLDDAILNNAMYDSLRIAYYQTFNPLDTALKFATFGLYYCDYYAADVFNKKVLPQFQYDERFKNLVSSEKRLGCLKGILLEALWKDIIYGNSFVSENIDSVYLSFKLFKQIFPNSSYLPLLSERFNNLSHTSQEANSRTNSLTFLNSSQYSTFSNLLKEFKGK